MALRAGSVGLGSEAGLGSRRGWRSGRLGASRVPAVRAGTVGRVSGGASFGPSGPRGLPLGLGLPPGERGHARGAGAGGRRRLWTRAGPYSRISSATVLATGPSPPGEGAALAGCLGWRLAADLELVRTRGIRLFN